MFSGASSRGQDASTKISHKYFRTKCSKDINSYFYQVFRCHEDTYANRQNGTFLTPCKKVW